MPKQNKRNHHLQKAREAKKLKLLNPLQIKRYLKANTRLMQTFEWIRSGLEIEELIYENIESDNDWKDLSLTTGLEPKLIRISKGRYLWYILMQQQRLLDKNKKY